MLLYLDDDSEKERHELEQYGDDVFDEDNEEQLDMDVDDADDDEEQDDE